VFVKEGPGPKKS